MDLISAWRAIDSRISGFTVAVDTFRSFIGKLGSPGGGVEAADLMGGYLVPQAERIVVAMVELVSQHDSSLPSEARKLLDVTCAHLRSSSVARQDSMGKLQIYATTFSVLRPEIAFLLSDRTIRTRGLVIRAMLHLQRLISVDGRLRDQWNDAFNKNETECEKLGAVQFLHHGIWAAKVNSHGERTDLVLGNKFEVDDAVRLAGEALILTEWKRVKAGENADGKIREAKIQLAQYSSGSLAGFELRRERYVILVCQGRDLQYDAFLQEREVEYRVLHVDVAPRTPSEAARSGAKRSR